MREPFGGSEVLSVVPHRIDLMGVLEGTTHGYGHGGLVELWVLNRMGDTVRLEVCGSEDGGQGGPKRPEGEKENVPVVPKFPCDESLVKHSRLIVQQRCGLRRG